MGVIDDCEKINDEVTKMAFGWETEGSESSGPDVCVLCRDIEAMIGQCLYYA